MPAAPLSSSPVLGVPAVFSDHLVLQRSAATALWGTAGPQERVAIALGPLRAEAVANAAGRWKVALDLRGLPEGPFDLVLEGSRRIVIADVLIGEVWLCAGQSNMAYALDRATGGAEEIARPANPRLRQFRVAEAKSDEPLEDCHGAWVTAGPASSHAFSAVSYYFGRDLQQALNVPVGIILSARAGTNAAAWISTDALDADPELQTLHEKTQKEEASYPARKEAYVSAMMEWEKTHGRQDRPAEAALYAGRGAEESAWRATQLPGPLRNGGSADAGATWLRNFVTLPTPTPATPVVIDPGGPHDFDAIYWNGQKIGETTEATATSRADTKRYTIPHELLREGDNLLAIRVFTPTENAGFSATPFKNIGPVRSFIESGWRARVEFALPPLTEQARRECPAIPSAPDPFCGGGRLYHSMIAPVIALTLAGVVWYQGEQDTGKSRALYRKLLETLIRDWRRGADRELPFVICQLPNFGPKSDAPGESTWAEIRQAQLDTLALPRTVEVITIDLGEDDIHPPDKKPVGERAALSALRGVYGRAETPSSPKLKSVRRVGETVVLGFDPAKGIAARPLPETYQPTYLSPRRKPLVAPTAGSELQGFALCGRDGKWSWAQARVEGDAVVVTCAAVAQPVSVRYAWANNPTCNLVGEAGLPASPFEADVPDHDDGK